MALSDVLDTIGGAVKKGAQVAGAVLPEVGQVIGDVADPDAAQRRQEQQQHELDLNRQVKAHALEEALKTMDEGPAKQAALQQYFDLYPGPANAGNLIQRLHQIIHPQGAVAQGPMQETLGAPNAGTLAQMLGQVPPPAPKANKQTLANLYEEKVRDAINRGNDPSKDPVVQQISDAMQNAGRVTWKQFKMPSGDLVWADVANPPEGATPIAAGAASKPVRAWKKDANGNALSVLIDPMTNQIMPGTEDASILPPPGMLNRISTSEYHWVDSNNQVHATPTTRTSRPVFPSTLAPTQATPTIPAETPQAAAPTPKPAAQPSTVAQAISKPPAGGPRGDRIIGDKRDPVADARYKAASAIVDKAKTELVQAKARQDTMDENEKDALNGNQQAMLSLVANHIGMTLGAQKGARITRSVWDESMASAPWIEAQVAKWFHQDENGDMVFDGYKGGVTLTGDQIKQMVNLAHQKVNILQKAVKTTQDTFAQELAGLGSPAAAAKGTKNPAPVQSQYSVGQVVKLKGQDKWVQIVKVKPDGTYSTKPAEKP